MQPNQNQSTTQEPQEHQRRPKECYKCALISDNSMVFTTISSLLFLSKLLFEQYSMQALDTLGICALSVKPKQHRRRPWKEKNERQSINI